MTDLVRHVEKFRKSGVQVRRGNIKCYLVDLALRNAILRLKEHSADDVTLGFYAENLVFNVLKRWPGIVDLSYYKDKKGEVDFIVTTGPGQFYPFEVKYRNQIKDSDLLSIFRFMVQMKRPFGFVIGKTREALTGISQEFRQKTVVFFTLAEFLILFD